MKQKFHTLRRPLFLLCSFFILLMMLFAVIIPKAEAELPYEDRQAAVLDGQVYRIEHKNEKAILYVKLTSGEGCMCYLEEGQEPARIGENIRFTGKVFRFSKATNPGMFDYEAYQNIRGLRFSAQNTVILERSGQCNVLLDALSRIREYCGEILGRFMSGSGILKTMLLGDKSELEASDKELFSEGGISHILAISGLHIALIGMGVFKLLSLLFRPLEKAYLRTKRRLPEFLYLIRALISIIFMALYGVMTGMSSSALRAIIMFAMSIHARRIGRTYDTLTALGIAALCIVIESPGYVLDGGFLLSFGAVAGISLILPMLETLFGRLQKQNMPYENRGMLHKRLLVHLRNLSAKVVELFLASLSVFIFTLPVMAYNYCEIHPWSILLNILVVPSVGVLAFCGIAVILIGALGSVPIGFAGGVLDVICRGLGGICDFMMQCYRAVTGFWTSLPGATIVTGRPELWQIVCYYILLLGSAYLVSRLGRRKKESLHFRAGIVGRLEKNVWNRRSARAILGGLWICMLILLLFLRLRPELRITMLDVGQGDGICVETQGRVYMIDAGSSSEKQLYQYRILPFCKSMAITKVDGWFVSHPDKDHISGLLEILECMKESEGADIRVEVLYLPDAATIQEDADQLIALAKEAGVRVEYISRGDKLRIGDLSIQCLHPKSEEYSEDPNSYSEMLLLELGDFEMLFTGDADIAAESEMLRWAGSVFEGRQIEILKVGHHGSASSTGQELLDVIGANVALISVGRNSYGHPTKQVLERLEDAGCRIYRTDECGAITVEVSDGGYRVSRYVGEG